MFTNLTAFMAIPERKEREREEIRKKILDAAHTLFERLGYEAVTMRAVAEAIEYSPATIYLHFENKDALVEELCKRDFSVLLGQMAQAPLPKDPVARLRAIGEVYAQFGLRNPNHYRFMFMSMTAGKFNPQRDRQDPGQQTFSLLRVCVEDLMADGVIPRGDVDEVGHVLWATLHGAVALLITYRGDQFPYKPVSPKFLEHVMDTTLAGLRALPFDGPATIH